MDKKLAELWKQKYYEKCTEINKLEQENERLLRYRELMEIPQIEFINAYPDDARTVKIIEIEKEFARSRV